LISAGTGAASRTAPVLLLRGDAAADVPLGLVLLQDLLDLEVEAPVVDGQALLDVLM
jgi:hypothetical protein